MYITREGDHYYIEENHAVVFELDSYYAACCVMRFCKGGAMHPEEYKAAVDAVKKGENG